MVKGSDGRILLRTMACYTERPGDAFGLTGLVMCKRSTERSARLYGRLTTLTETNESKSCIAPQNQYQKER